MWILFASIVLFIIVIGFIIYLGAPKTTSTAVTQTCNRCSMPMDRCGCPFKRQCQFC